MDANPWAAMLLFFVRVNQVLVRLWTRAMSAQADACAEVPWSDCMSDRTFILWMNSHDRAARVQRREKGFVGFVGAKRWRNGQKPVVC